jgi:hypothetical protein
MTDSQIDEKKGDKLDRNRKVNKILLPIIGVIFLALIVIVVVSSYSNRKAAKFDATIDTESLNAVDDNTVAVTFHVTNNGTKADTPMCMINVGDTSYTYDGADQVTLKTVEPGATVTSTDNIKVNKQGAAHINTAKIDCR